MADGATHDELLEEHNEVLLQELLLMEEQEDLLSLQRMRTQNRIPVLISQTIWGSIQPNLSQKPIDTLDFQLKPSEGPFIGLKS